MTNQELAERVKQLEADLKELRGIVQSAGQVKDWRRAIGFIGDDDGMRAIFQEAKKIREADRRATRPKSPKRRKPSR